MSEWLMDYLPPPPSYIKLNNYLDELTGRQIQDKTFWTTLECQYMSPEFFTIIGQIPKWSNFKNRRKIDEDVLKIEDDLGTINDGQWGLTKPNQEAFYKALGKFQKKQFMDYDEDALKFAFECMVAHFGPHLKDCDIESNEVSKKRLDMSTSNGAALAMVYKTKADLIDTDFFQSLLDKGWDRLLDDTFYFFTGTALKEEIRNKEKINLNKIRLFNPSSVEFTVLLNRLCGQFNDKFTEANLKTSSAVGISPFHGGWDRVYRYLLSTGKHNDCDKMEADATDWDSSLGFRIPMLIYKFRFMMLKPELQTEENYIRMMNAAKNVFFSVMILFDGTVVGKYGGNPSGSANTVVDNTLILYFMFAYIYYLLIPDKRSYYYFSKYVTLLLYGDDNLSKVHIKIQDRFTPVNISKEFSKVGMTMNFESEKFVNMDEISFLQADFKHFINGTCIYHVEPFKGVESMRWNEKAGDPINKLQRAIGLYIVSWSDLEARMYYNNIIKSLIRKYEPVCGRDQEWINVKHSYKNDFDMMKLYTGFEYKVCKKDQKANQTLLIPNQTFEENGITYYIHSNGDVSTLSEDAEYSACDDERYIFRKHSKRERPKGPIKKKKRTKKKMYKYRMQHESDDRNSHVCSRCCSVFCICGFDDFEKFRQVLDEPIILNKQSMQPYVALPQRPPRVRRRMITPDAKERNNLAKVVAKAPNKVVAEAREVQSITDHNKAKKKKRKRTTRTVRLNRAISNSVKIQSNNLQKFGGARNNYNRVSNSSAIARGVGARQLAMAVAMPSKFPPFQWPDAYAAETCPFKSRNTFDLPLLTGSYGPDFAAGSQKLFMTPSFVNPLMILDETTPVEELSYGIYLTRQAPYLGLRLPNNDLDDDDDLMGMMTLSPEPKNILGLLTRKDTDPAVSTLPFRNFDTEGNTFFGYSFNLTSGSCVLLIETDYLGATITGGLQLQLITESAPPVTIPFDLLQGVSTVALSGAQLADYNGNNMVGFRISLTTVEDNTDDCIVLSIRFEIGLQPEKTHLLWKPIQFKGFESAVEIYNKYRVCAQSILSTFTGPTINNGGQIAALCTNGKPFLYTGTERNSLLWRYEGISSAPGNYNGPINTGAYSWFKPDDSGVMNFRPLNKAVDKIFTYPHVIVSYQFAVGSSGLSTGIIRCENFTNYECTTDVTYVPRLPSPVDTGTIKAYMKSIIENRDIPTSMPNDWHEVILKQLGNVRDLVTKGAPMVGEIASGLKPLISLLGFL